MSAPAKKSALIVPGREVADAAAEKKRILEEVGDISGLVVMGNRILVAKWIREKEGSFITVAETKNEDNWQGKVGLVLAVGPLAYKESEDRDWGAQTVKPGDWVQFHRADGEDFGLRPRHSFKIVNCAWLKEGAVQAVLPRPDLVH